MPEALEGLNGDARDRSLLAASAAGDRDAFGELVGRHRASVFRLARTLARDADAAEDVLQQTFLSAWRASRQFRGDASVRTWLLTIARHQALARRRSLAREPIDPTPLDELGIRAGWGGPNPEQLASLAEERDRLKAAFARLSSGDQEMLTLRDLEGLSGEEAAAIAGLTVAAMKSRLHRARMALAAQMKEDAAHAARRP
ncbi:MAG TPA: sigma-70 family RNA polymerase sigma factor [Vicinamibacterales bacterium]